jgi:hypothetical protein
MDEDLKDGSQIPNLIGPLIANLDNAEKRTNKTQLR